MTALVGWLPSAFGMLALVRTLRRAHTPSANAEEGAALTRDIVDYSHRQVYYLPVAKARFVDPFRRMAFVGAHV